MAHLTVESHLVADELIHKLFEQTLIADVTDYQKDVSRKYMQYGKINWDE